MMFSPLVARKYVSYQRRAQGEEAGTMRIGEEPKPLEDLSRIKTRLRKSDLTANMGCMFSRERGAIPLWPTPENFEKGGSRQELVGIETHIFILIRSLLTIFNTAAHSDLLQPSEQPGPALAGSKGQ